MSYLRIRRHYRGVWFEPENAPKKTFLVHNSSSGSAVIKKSLMGGGRGGVHPMYVRRVNRVKDVLPLNKEFLKNFDASW